MTLRHHTTEADHIATGRAALQSMIRDGVVSVGEVDSTGLSPGILRETDMSGLCYQELVGFDLGRREAHAMVQQRGLPGTRRCRAGREST